MNSWNAGRAVRRQREPDRGRSTERRSSHCRADRTTGGVHRGEPGEGDEDDQDDEAHRVDVIGKLFAGDDPPATGQPIPACFRWPSPGSTGGRQALSRWLLSSELPMK